MTRHITLVYLFLGLGIAMAQPVQWASRVIQYSSQYNATDCSARQVIGPPNVLPLGGDRPGAWAAGEVGRDGRIYEPRTEQILVVGYARPARLQQVAVAESWCPGAISSIYLIDTSGQEHIVYVAEPRNLGTRGRMFCALFPRTPYLVNAVKLVMHPAEVDGWNEIDAIGISESRDSIRAFINLTADVAFTTIPEHLGPAVNSPLVDYVPVISPDGHTLYFARDNDSQNIGGVLPKGNIDIWESHTDEHGQWSDAGNVGRPLNTAGPNTVFSVLPDGNTLLVANVYAADGTMTGDGYSLTTLTSSGWTLPESLRIDGYYNLNKVGEAFLGGSGEVLLVSVELSDAIGGTDICVCFRKQDGSWTSPRSLGPDVNSPMNDISPFLASDDRTLYFATAGRAGYGNADIFMTRRIDSTWTHWTEPVNLGPAVNTQEFDGYFSISASGDYAYFTSAQAGSFGKTDIYRIKLPESVRPRPVVLVSGRVMQARTGKPIDAEIRYENLSTGRSAGRARTSPGTGKYAIVLPAGANYGFRAQVPGYFPVSDNLNATGVKRYTEVSRDLILPPTEVGQVVRLNNIFFAFTSDSLEVESVPELQRCVDFLRENVLIHIALAGHTDNIGTAERNQDLSRRRSVAVMNYFVQHGIAANRIVANGFGHSMPVASNTTEEGRRLNRRVEFTIVE
jgi:outer membrane protein OmpA-like peptidoglycan-associated protein